MAVNCFNGKVFCLITGASRGLGKEIALQFASKLSPNSVVCITARNSDLLQKTRQEIEQHVAPKKLLVLPYSIDHSTATYFDYCKILQHARSHCQEQDGKDIQSFILVHNASVLGDPKARAANCIDMSVLDDFYRINFTHTILLNSAAKTIFGDVASALKTVVNISSEAALKPFKNPGLAVYWSTKAARYSYFLTLAYEEPLWRILSYAPGPMKTDMLEELGASDIAEMRDFKAQMESSGRLLSVEETTEKLCNVLMKNQFESGSQVDFFDN